MNKDNIRFKSMLLEKYEIRKKVVLQAYVKLKVLTLGPVSLQMEILNVKNQLEI